MRFLLLLLIAVIGALVWHAIIISQLSLAMGRYRGPGGRVVNSIASHPLHLAGLALVLVAGLLIAFPLSKPVLPFQLGVAAMLSGADVFLVWKAIKSVDRFAD